MVNPSARQYCLTWPKCSVSKDTALDFLKKLENASAAVVGQEHHEDGDLHLHAFIKFDTRARRETTAFDLDGHHANVQICKSVKNWMNYILKEDKKPAVWNYDVEAFLQKKAAFFSTKRAAECTTEELAEKLHPRDFNRVIQSIQMYKLLTEKVEKLSGPCGIWIFGRPGTGKSYGVREFALL